MDKIPPAPGKYPLPEMKRLRFNAFHSDTIERIALQALHQMMAGQLTIPIKVELIERHVTNRYLRGYKQVEYRLSFAVRTGMASQPTTTWMVKITAPEPDKPNGHINDTSFIDDAEVYEWEDQKGWQKALTYKHKQADPDPEPFFDSGSPFDWPPQY